MTENNRDPREKDSRPDRPPEPPGTQVPPKPKKKKRRLLLKVFAGLVVLIVLLVLLAPSIISTGFVRDIVVGQINGSALNGKLQIKDWSFGWTSGVSIEGVELVDANNVHLLSVAQISTPISFLKAATGDIDLGDVIIKGVDFNAVMDSNGQLNVLGAIKASNASSNAPPSNQPLKLPNIKGTLHLQNVTGTFQDDRDKVAIGLPQQTPLNVTIAIKDINQPIEDTIDLGLQLDERDLVQVKVSGTLSAIQNNLVDVQNLAADQTIELSQGDLAAVTQLLHSLHLNLDVTGKMDGKIVANVSTLNDISADVGINMTGLSAGGQQLAGDTIAFDSVGVGVTASVASSAIKLDMPITMQSKGAAKPDQINVHADVPLDSLTGTTNAFQAILARLTKSTGAPQTATIPGAGNIKISADVNVANLVGQVPHLLHLEQGTSLTSGQLTHETTITLANGQAVIATKTDLTDFSGTSNGTGVQLQDIDASAGVTAVGGDHPDFHDVNVGLSSAFANVQGGGATLGKLKFQGSSDLQNLQRQVGQVVDLDSLFHAPAGSHVSLVGTLGFDAHTDGDFTADDQMIGVGADLNASGVNINIPGRRTINEPKFTASIGANLHHTTAQFVEAARGVAISIQSPAINFAAGGDVVLGGKFGATAPSFAITQGNIDLRLLQEEFGGVLSLFVAPAAEGQPATLVQRIADDSVRVASGSVTISGKGSFDDSGFGLTEPLAITIQPTDLTVADEMGTVQTKHVPMIALAVSAKGSLDGGLNAQLTQLEVQVGDGLKIEGDPQSPLVVQTNPALAVSGSVRLVNADLPKLIDLAAIALPPEEAASLNQLTSGSVTGSVRLDNQGSQNKVTAEIAVDSLTVGNLLNNEKAHVLATAILEGDWSAIHDVTVGVDTSFAKTLSISNGQIVLATRQGDELVPVGLFDKLQSVNIEADDVDLAKVDGLVNLLFAQAAAPAPGEKVIANVPPPQITQGTATLKANISRSGNDTTANVTQAVVHGLTIKTGNTQYAWPNDLTAQLTAAVQTRADPTGQMPPLDQLVQASVDSLSIDSGIGTTIGLSAQKPIVATNLSDPANMSVQGGVSIAGDIARLARVAEAMGGAKPNMYPYQGQFNLDESLAKVESQPRLHLAGGGTVTNFVVMGPPGPNGAPAPQLFAENKITLSNPLEFDFKTFSVIIDPSNPVAVALQSTGALSIGVTGTVNDVLIQRQIADDNKIVVRLSYDLAKLWPIIKPLLSPSQQQSLADLTISGVQQRMFTVSGSFPADKSFSDAIAMLSAGGYFTVDSVSTQGITLQNFDMPFALSGGILRTVYPDQPEGSNAPHAATCNGGTLNLGVWTLDLRTDPMLLTLAGASPDRPLQLLQGVTINPTMSKTLFGKILNNPAFVGAKQARGLVDVSVLHLDQLPLSDLLTQASPQNKGTAEVQYSVHELQLGSQLLAAFGDASVSADISNADVKLAGGRVTEDTTMMIDGNKPLRFAGVVVLATEQFAPMTTYIPTALLSKFIPANVQQYVPDQVTVPLKGDMNKPQLELDKTIAQLVKDAAKKALLNGILQGLQRH